MNRLLMAIERLRRRFDFSGAKDDEVKLSRAAAAKRPPKRKRRR